MVSGHRYRTASAAGTVLASVVAVVVANHPAVQSTLTNAVPLAHRLPAIVLTGDALALAVVTTAVVVVLSVFPLFKPRPRRILDTISLVQKRVIIAGLGLAAVGYFDYTYRLPRTTLAVTVGVLFLSLPVWFVVIRRQPGGSERVIVVGDDPEEIHEVLNAANRPMVGYVSPPSPYYSEDEPLIGQPAVADGSGASPLDDMACLGGLSRLDEVLVGYDIDTAILAFAHLDRAEFFGALDTCYEHGVDAKIHQDHADSVLTATTGSADELVDIELEPWDWQDYVLKRTFDVTFAAVGLLALMPFIMIIAAAIKFDSPGPVFYKQNRTAVFGETFKVYKFRSMVTNAEDGTGARLSEEDDGGVDPRVTRVGCILRRVHLDEVPQLWSILVGDMSVVGPRPERPELDADIHTGVVEWRKRWFIKPGLTGLAQINGITGYQPEAKLRCDIKYIREQSFWFDLKIVVRQVWAVVSDVIISIKSTME